MKGIEPNRPSVFVMGVGASTPLGKTAPASAAAIRAGITAFGDHPYLLDGDGEPFVVASAPYLPEDLSIEERCGELALPAAQEALACLERISVKGQNIPLILGMPARRPGVPSHLGQAVATRLESLTTDLSRSGGSTMSEISFLPHGHAAGLMALEAACRRLRNRECLVCLVGAVDSYLDPDTLEWIESCDQLHTGSNAWGYIPGEAAGFCLLALETTAVKYGLPTLGKLVAVSTAREENRIKTETVCIGKGLSKAVGDVAVFLPSERSLIDYTICDLNGEAYRSAEFGFMIARFSERFVNATDFLSPADCWGDVGAASGLLFVMLVASARSRGYAEDRYTLLWTSSEGGERAAAIMRTEPLTGVVS